MRKEASGEKLLFYKYKLIYFLLNIILNLPTNDAVRSGVPAGTMLKFTSPRTGLEIQTRQGGMRGGSCSWSRGYRLLMKFRTIKQAEAQPQGITVYSNLRLLYSSRNSVPPRTQTGLNPIT